MSFPKNDRKVQSNTGKHFPETAIPSLFVPTIAAALKAEFGGGPSAVKTVARITGANERAARNWFEGKNGPNGDNLMSLIQHSDSVLGAVLDLSNRQKLTLAYNFFRFRDQLAGLIVAIDEAEFSHSLKDR